MRDCIMPDDSVCLECKCCVWDQDEKDDPGVYECTEGMDNFGTEEGCYDYMRRSDSDYYN